MTTLLQIWMSQRGFFETKSIEQLISIAGDGTLRDGNETSNQLRELFANLPSMHIEKYVNACLTHAVSQGGLVLQDLVNEIGSRLGFSLESGRYRGGGSRIGFDGIWRAQDGYAFVVEVKTTDAYQLNLDTQAGYRQKLIGEGRITESASSILLVVGRSDTGGLEAQTRGSRHAWDVRLISVDALLKLMHVKENLSSSATVVQIQEILKPLEYTRVDRLIDIIFRTSEDLQIDETEEADITEAGPVQEGVVQSRPVSYHDACISRISAQLGIPLIKQGRCTYTNADQSTRILCIVSKQYERSGSIRYWYAFHPSQADFLNEGKEAYVALGCGSADQIILMPANEFTKYLPAMRTTELENRKYWHVEVFKKGDVYQLNKATSEGVDVTRYLVRSSNAIRVGH